MQDYQNLDPYDLHLSCRCGMALRCYSNWDHDRGAFVLYAANVADARQDEHVHDVAVVMSTIGNIDWTVYEGKCQQED